LSQLLSKETVTYPAVFASNVQCVGIAAGRRTLKMCCYKIVLFSIVAFKKLPFHKIV